MGKKNKAKEKAQAYLEKASSDGKLTNKEIKKATGKGLSMDSVLNRAASQGTVIGNKAQENYGIKQGKNASNISYTPGSSKVATNPMEVYQRSMGGKGGQPEAQKHGLYAGVDKKGQHVYRYGAGQSGGGTQAPAAAPSPAPQAPATPGYQPERPSDPPSSGQSWNDFIAGVDSSAQSRPSSYGSDTDPGNPNLFGDIKAEGVKYQNRFGGFIDDAIGQARMQAWEVGDAGRQALTRLQATPPKLADPLSPEMAKDINRFSKKIKFA